ncbi:TPA: bifunctional 4-hydroxy-2-oxoglutarate aldolase/2-dehydro-3-deoxy-phosphogluconate aldolase, partial [Enterococcus faecium]|nr:bifunctional 4-hydroxy-2-oxoglutarate aldolase/2-dehydro-3-deoxy-phosphogluconate aldolase [Enterococcus faecium]
MRLADYPKLTVIMRGYTFDQADAILQAMQEFDHQFAVEMTMNTKGALENIHELNQRYGDTTYIGAGTVRTLEQAQACYEAGAKFLLGPHMFTKEMLSYANKKGLLAVPAAMTPSEVDRMFKEGADIVKVFPAAVVTPRFFKDIQAPLGKLPLMGVGGISKEN